MLKQEDRYAFYIASLLKTTRPAFHQMPLECLACPHTLNLCVVRYLDEYIICTQQRHNDCFQLLISPSKPFKGVKSYTIGRWLREVLTDAGVDTKTFAAHSTTSASADQLLVLRRKGCQQWNLLEQLAGRTVGHLQNTMINLWNLTLAMPF